VELGILVVGSGYVNKTMKELSEKIDQNIVINNVTSCDLHIKKL
jgi:glucan phosphoethanolaminetransferase (alkaline phosphatase superfamily)